MQPRGERLYYTIMEAIRQSSRSLGPEGKPQCLLLPRLRVIGSSTVFSLMNPDCGGNGVPLGLCQKKWIHQEITPDYFNSGVNILRSEISVFFLEFERSLMMSALGTFFYIIWRICQNQIPCEFSSFACVHCFLYSSSLFLPVIICHSLVLEVVLNTTARAL